MTTTIYITPAGRAAFDLRTSRAALLIEAKATTLPRPTWADDIPDGWTPPAAPAPMPVGFV